MFSNINLPQGSVATYARISGILNNQFTANVPGNLPLKKIANRLRFGRIMAMRCGLTFLSHRVRKLTGEHFSARSTRSDILLSTDVNEQVP